MKYTKYIFSIIFSVLLIAGIAKAITVLYPGGGGTGTTQTPTYGKVLVGQTNGTYLPQATSTLGIGGLTSVGMTVPTGLTVSGSPITTSGTLSVSLTSGYVIPLTASTTEWKNASSNWTFSNNYGAVNLTSSSTMPWWAKGGINASSTSHFVYASTTAFTISGNSYLGTVSSGIWNGTSIGDSYIDDTITLTNLTQITNRAISDTTGTLTVARGGTGQTSFGQGWLHSDGTTLTSSTSPTVAYITATSTTATSTFPSINASTAFQIGSDYLTDITGTNLSITNGVLSATGGSAVGTVSTSTTPTIGNLAYWTSSGYPSLLGTVATTSLTGTAPMVFSNPISVIGGSASVLTCTEASGSVAGCLSSANWTTFNGKQAGDATLTALAGLTISAGSLITGTGADAFSVLAGGTNGFVLAMSGATPTWVATTTLSTISGTLDISTQSNLTAGTNITLTNDDLSVDDAFLLNNGDIGTGVYDFGGATSLELPNGASPTVDILGELALQTSPTNALIIATSTNASYPGILPIAQPIRFNVASSTWTSTSTVGFATLDWGERVPSGICWTTAGTALLRVGNGTNWSNETSITTSTTTITFTSNNKFNANGEKLLFEIGTPSSVKDIKCSFRRLYELN